MGARTCDVLGYNIIATYTDGNNDTRTVTELIPGGDSRSGYIYDLPYSTPVTITVGAESFTFGGLDPQTGESVDIVTLPGMLETCVSFPFLL